MTRQAPFILVSLLVGLPWATHAEDATTSVKIATSTVAPAAIVPTPPTPPTTPTTPTAPTVPAIPPAAAKTPAAARPNLNEMRGKFQSSSDDDQTLRVTVDGGFNVGFTYGKNTSWLSGGAPFRIEDLNYGDELIVRYSGRDLYAIEVERVNKAP